jgi:photosystem II stability/assembly factor-like uncharacterized protein
VTFVSPTDGWVLGSTPCPRTICTSVVRTRDGGHSWRGIPAPHLALGGRGVSRLRFGSHLDGFAYGPALASTHDGGATWRSVSMPGDVLALEIARGVAYAIVGRCGDDGCRDGHLYRAPITTDSWQQVDAVTAAALPLLIHGETVGVGSSASTVYASTDSGRTWAVRPNPCARFRDLALADLAATAGDLAALCTGEGAAGSSDKAILASPDSGRTWQLRSHGFSHGDGGLLATATSSIYLLATQSARSWLGRSTDGGRTFTTLPEPDADGGLLWNDLGFTNPMQGVVILGTTLYVTRDAGETWHPAAFDLRERR